MFAIPLSSTNTYMKTCNNTDLSQARRIGYQAGSLRESGRNGHEVNADAGPAGGEMMRVMECKAACLYAIEDDHIRSAKHFGRSQVSRRVRV